MPNVGKVEEMGSLWVSTASAIEIAKRMVREEQEAKEQKRRRNITISQELNANDNLQNKLQFDNQETTLDNMAEINLILNKAGLKGVFPFVPQLNENKEIVGFVPKGKNEKEIKENIMEYKAKMQEALEKGKITDEEFEKLEENLDELMKENNIKLDAEKEMEVTDKEIMDNIKQFIMHNYGPGSHLPCF